MTTIIHALFPWWYCYIVYPWVHSALTHLLITFLALLFCGPSTVCAVFFVPVWFLMQFSLSRFICQCFKLLQALNGQLTVQHMYEYFTPTQLQGKHHLFKLNTKKLLAQKTNKKKNIKKNYCTDFSSLCCYYNHLRI